MLLPPAEPTTDQMGQMCFIQSDLSSSLEGSREWIRGIQIYYRVFKNYLKKSFDFLMK